MDSTSCINATYLIQLCVCVCFIIMNKIKCQPNKMCMFSVLLVHCVVELIEIENHIGHFMEQWEWDDMQLK